MSSQIPESLKGIKALTFDMFGTVVDWRSTVHEQLVSRTRAKIGSPSFGSLPDALRNRLRAITDDDWARFTQEWRDSYMVFTSSFVPGESEWKDTDTHHYDSLVELLHKWELTGAFTDDEILSLSLVWHHLKPWDDSSAGIRSLGARYVTAMLSNGNPPLLHDLNEYGNLGFQQIMSTADFGAYKPHPSIYLGAVKALDCRSEQVAMVAAHLWDLQAARSHGLRTIYVERPQEEAWGCDEDRFKDARNWVDLWIGEREHGFIDVARRLGILEVKE
ncbi:HAD-like domain-containing protein [Biscogniauxia sp. FL1348]|nr:HAD-like domain-containing protein [Biscogniauxia sp. FL1348]